MKNNRQSVDKQQHIGAPIPEVTLNPHLVDTMKIIVLDMIEIHQLDNVKILLAVLLHLHLNAVPQLVV